MKIKAFPIILIISGLIFLIQNLGIMEHAFKKLWPLLIIGWGIGKLAEGINGG